MKFAATLCLVSLAARGEILLSILGGELFFLSRSVLRGKKTENATENTEITEHVIT